MEKDISVKTADTAVKRLDKELPAILADMWVLIKRLPMDPCTADEAAAFARLKAVYNK